MRYIDPANVRAVNGFRPRSGTLFAPVAHMPPEGARGIDSRDMLGTPTSSTA
jgi:hypothetical protein